ncbi:hypothetical protein MADP12_00015 [Mycoplasma anatis]|uniref:restriction endonuclease subunit S n=1 Tax=Mycoplasmopsis anatis TaxID=171279 RepID=UPI001C4EFD6A|nr:restriction endonuclease subunit S [Mycoplasmopsis anatis]MBW0599389.1 hypothetical protein [Mycoplasmopsis anatis]
MSKIWDLIKNEKVEWKTIGEVCKLIQGYSFSAKKFQTNGDYKIIRISNIKNEEIDTKNVVYVSKDEYKDIDLEKYKINQGDILIAMSGASVGKIGMNYSDEINLFLNQRVGKFLPNSYVLNNKYLYFWLSEISESLVKNIQNQSIANLSTEMILCYEIPIPSIDTQNKIVKILDKFNIYVKELVHELVHRNKQYQHYRDYILNKYLFKLCKKNGTNIEKRKLCELLEYEQPGKYIVKKPKYSNKFNTPVLTPGKTFILGYTNEIEGIYKANKNNPVILFEDFTAAFKWVDFEFKIKSSATKIISPKININLKYCFYNMQMLNFINEEHKRIWISEYSQIKINIPNIKIQNKVVEILDIFFNSTNKMDEGLPKEIKLRKQQYEYYRNKLLDFPKN